MRASHLIAPKPFIDPMVRRISRTTLLRDLELSGHGANLAERRESALELARV